MKIVHLCLCGLFGEKYAYQDNLLTKYHRRIGLDVTIIAPTMARFTSNGGVVHEPIGEKILDNGCKLIRVKNKYASERFNTFIRLYEDITPIILAEAPDYIFVHNLLTFNYLCLLKVKRSLPNVKIVFDNHMDEYNSNKNIFSKFLNKVIFRHFVVKRLLPLSDFFYGVTPSRCSFLKEVFSVPEKKVHYLPMGADDEKINLEKRQILREGIRKEYGIADYDFLIVTGGKIDRIKHIDLLVKAVAETESPNVKILLFGSIVDELKPIINSFLSQKVIYVGWIDSDTVYQYFYAADLVMFPGLHSAMWEQAVAARSPIAVSRLKGFDHVDFNGNCLFLYESNVEYYKSFVESISNDKERYEQLKCNANNDGANMFLYSNIAKKVIEDLEKLAI